MAIWMTKMLILCVRYAFSAYFPVLKMHVFSVQGENMHLPVVELLYAYVFLGATAQKQ